MCTLYENIPLFINDEINKESYNFKWADIIYNFAKHHNLDIRAHTIVWYRHFPKSLKDYLNGKSLNVQKELTYKLIRNFMEQIATRYPNCYCVDVLNEIASDSDEINYLKEEGLSLYEIDSDGIRIDDWYKILGKDYYIKVLSMAREVFGNKVKLFYNDNNETNKEKQKVFKTIIDNIKKYEQENNINILDGFGMQSHYWGSETKEQIKQSMDFAINLGKEIQITEFDVSNHESKEKQENVLKSFIEEAKLHHFETFTIWGLNDDLSWLSEYSPTLIDKDFNNKPFLDEYLKQFSNKYNNKN